MAPPLDGLSKLFSQVLIEHHVKTKLEDNKPAEKDVSIIEIEDDDEDESKIGRSSLLNESSDEEPKPVVKPVKKKTSDEDSDDKFERCKATGRLCRRSFPSCLQNF